MADVTDLKSVGRDTVRVQVPFPAPIPLGCGITISFRLDHDSVWLSSRLMFSILRRITRYLYGLVFDNFVITTADGCQVFNLVSAALD